MSGAVWWWFLGEWRIGWHQGAVNRHEAAAARHIAALDRLGAEPHRPSECSVCSGRAVMSGAVERIEAALGAMEAAAKAATGADRTGNWWIEPDEGGVSEISCLDVQGFITAVDVDAAHIVTHNPAAVLALVDGLRVLVALHQPIQMLTGPVCTSCGDADEHAVEWPCPTLDALTTALGVGAE